MKMARRSKLLPLILALGLSICLSGCEIPTLGFADYNVSGYIKGLLDSSYLDNHTQYMSFTGQNQETAQKNHTSTVDNAVTIFCELYAVSPTEAQRTQFQEIFHQAYLAGNYTVKTEEKVNTGYYLEVDITPITNFTALGSKMKALRSEAEQELAASSSSSSAKEPEYDEYGNLIEYDENGNPIAYDEYGNLIEYDENGNPLEYDEYGNLLEPDTSSATPKPGNSILSSQALEELYAKMVLEYCQSEVSNLNYSTSPVTISLNIIQTEKGELQLDLTQIQAIDKTVVQLV